MTDLGCVWLFGHKYVVACLAYGL